MTTLIDARRGSGGARKRRPLEGGLARLGSRGDSAISRALWRSIQRSVLTKAVTIFCTFSGCLLTQAEGM